MAEKSYFKKLVVSTPIRLSTGKKVDWINVGWNTGALETDDAALIAELSALNGKGGVYVIDKATFDGLKKNTKTQSPRLQWKPQLSGQALVQNPVKPASAKSTAPAAAVVKPVEKPEKPTVAKGVFADIDTIHKAE